MTVRQITIPLMIQANAHFEPVPDYDGSDTGLVKLSFDPAVAGQGYVKLPKEIFSAWFLKRLDWPTVLKELHNEALNGR